MDERELLILSLEPVVRSAVSRMSTPARRTLRDDMLSEAWIGAIQAVDAYRGDRGASLATFAAHRIYGQIHDFLDRQRLVRRKAVGIHEDDPIRLPPAEFKPEFMPPASTDVAKLACDHVDAVRLVGQLSPRNQRIVLERAILQSTLQELADDNGITESRACQIVGRDVRASERSCRRCRRTFTVLGEMANPKLCPGCQATAPPKRRRTRKPRPDQGGACGQEAS